MLLFKKQGELTFYLSKVEKVIEIEVADTPIKREIGLMFRSTMKSNQGMLFLMETEETQSFWMQNTYLSLDILYVNRHKEVIDIYPNTTPFSTVSLPSAIPALYVVEVNAGFCEKYKIGIGTRIDWKLEADVKVILGT